MHRKHADVHIDIYTETQPQPPTPKQTLVCLGSAERPKNPELNRCTHIGILEIQRTRGAIALLKELGEGSFVF